ncbi:MAG: hypothetical protein WAW37_09815 [Syntrophobacteraceae bacterium]
MKQCDEILERTLRLADLMADVADLGDGAREDVGCGVLYGFLRDSAFKLRKMAEEEKEAHARKSRAGEKRTRTPVHAAGAGQGSKIGGRSGAVKK